jgi:alpha-2-macroglobulin
VGTTHEMVLDEALIQQTGNEIKISSSGNGMLFYSVTGIHYSDAAREEKKGAISLNIVRDYFRLVPQKTGDQILYDLQPLSGPVAQGDTLAVRLTVTGSDWRYLMAEDPIPAGTEFVEHDELYHFPEKPSWWEYWFTRRELHDDRMAIFDRHFEEGQKRFFYVLKVVNPGAFHVSPARVGPMYQPGIIATTESKVLEVR